MFDLPQSTSRPGFFFKLISVQFRIRNVRKTVSKDLINFYFWSGIFSLLQTLLLVVSRFFDQIKKDVFIWASIILFFPSHFSFHSIKKVCLFPLSGWHINTAGNTHILWRVQLFSESQIKIDYAASLVFTCSFHLKDEPGNLSS